MLKIKDLSKRYKLSKRNYFTALDRVSLDIENENMVAIIGESGSGKSTLMNLVSTIDSPSGGYVEFNGQKVTFNRDGKKSRYRRENIGFVFQSFNLIKELTALENVALVMDIAGVDKKTRLERAKELLELVGLKDMINKKPGTLSGGQKQRVAIARALANDPELLLADEPTGALDHQTSLEIMKLLATIANSGKKVVIVTHDMKVASYCERIIRMEDGVIIEDNVNENEELEKIDLPKFDSKKGMSFGLGGVFVLAWNSFRRKFKRNFLISMGTAISIASLLLVSISTSSIKGYLNDIQSIYGNAELIKLEGYEFSLGTGPRMNGGSGVTFEQIDEIYNISDYPHIEYREVYNPKDFFVFDKLSVIFNGNTKVSQSYMYPEKIKTFGKGDLLAGEAPVNDNEVAIASNLVSALGYSYEEAIGKTIELEIKNEQIDVVEEFVISAVLTDSSIRSFESSIYFTNDYALKYKSDVVIPKFTYTEYLVIEEGYTDDFMDYMAQSDQKAMQSGYLAIGSRDLEIVAFLMIALDAVFIVFGIILGISVIVAAIMIAVMSYVSILERIREVGVLRAVGARRSDVIKMFSLEALSIGILSGLIALAIGIGLSYVAIAIVNTQFDSSLIGTGINVKLTVIPVLVTFFGAIILSVVSSILSIGLGLRISPAEALRRK